MDNYHPHQHRNTFYAHVSDNPIHWLSAIGMTVLIVILILLNVSLARSIGKFRQKNENQACKYVLWPTLTAFLFTATAISCLITTILITITGDFNHENIIDDVLTKISINLYILSETLMIYSFIKRIDGAFHGSTIQYPPILIRSLYSTSVVFVIFCVALAVALAFEFMIIFLVLLLLWMILYLCLSSILCILFIRKVNMLLHAVINHIDKDLLHVVIKQSILIPMAICTSFTCYIMLGLVQYSTASTQWIPAAIFWIVVDCTVSSIAMFLLFSWNNYTYDKYCHLLHHLFEKNKLKSSELSSKNMFKSKITDGLNTVVISNNDASYIVNSTNCSSKDTSTADNKQFIANKPKLTIVESVKRAVTGSTDKNAFSEILIDVPVLDKIQSAPVSHLSPDTFKPKINLQSTTSLK